MWETSTGRCLRTVALEGPVSRVAWAPVRGLSLVLAAVGARLLLLNPGRDIGAHRVAAHTDALLVDAPPHHDHTSQYLTCCILLTTYYRQRQGATVLSPSPVRQ